MNSKKSIYFIYNFRVPIVQNNSKIKKHNQNDETHRDVVDVLILGAGLAGLGNNFVFHQSIHFTKINFN